MNKILCIFNTDSDTSLVHPKTKEHLLSDCGDYYFFIEDKDLFISSLLNNDFEISNKVYSSLLDYLSLPESKLLLNLEQSSHYFGNYSIDIVHKFIECI